MSWSGVRYSYRRPALSVRVRAEAPVVLHEQLVAGLAHVHRRQARLPLLDGRQAEQEAGERLPRAVVGRRLGGEAARELVVPAVLEEPEHVPLEVLEVSADFQRVLSPRPREPVAHLQERVVVLARRAQQRVTERLEALDVEERQPVGVLAAESDALDPELRDQIVPRGRRLADPVQPHVRDAHPHFVHETSANRLDEARCQILQPVVVVRAKAGQVLRRIPPLLVQRVAAEHERPVLPAMIEANGRLVVLEVLGSRVEIVVERPAHAHAHAVRAVREGHVLLQHLEGDRVDPFHRNLVARELRPDEE